MCSKGHGQYNDNDSNDHTKTHCIQDWRVNVLKRSKAISTTNASTTHYQYSSQRWADCRDVVSVLNVPVSRRSPYVFLERLVSVLKVKRLGLVSILRFGKIERLGLVSVLQGKFAVSQWVCPPVYLDCHVFIHHLSRPNHNGVMGCLSCLFRIRLGLGNETSRQGIESSKNGTSRSRSWEFEKMERLGLVSVLRVDRLGLVSVLWLNVLWTSPADCMQKILSSTWTCTQHSVPFQDAAALSHVLRVLRE